MGGGVGERAGIATAGVFTLERARRRRCRTFAIDFTLFETRASGYPFGISCHDNLIKQSSSRCMYPSQYSPGLHPQRNIANLTIYISIGSEAIESWTDLLKNRAVGEAVPHPHLQ